MFLRILILLVVACPGVYGQFIGFKFTASSEKLEMPFVRINNFVIIKVIIDDTLPLSMILDTGAENTILLKEEIATVLRLAYDKQKIYIRGADGDTLYEANIIRRVKLSLGGAQAIQDLIVFADSPMDLDSKLGMPIDGILGADILRGYQVLIDYKKQRLIIRKPQAIRNKKFVKYPIEVVNNRPFIKTTAWFTPTDSLGCRLLIDTGADLNLLLYTNSHPAITMPAQLIPVPLGFSLGGTIDGVLGRIHQFKMGDFDFYGVPTHYQKREWQPRNTEANTKNGLIGNHLLAKFHVIIDFSNNSLYLKPERRLKKKFTVDRSGLFIVSPSPLHDSHVVSYVIPKSPGWVAGLRAGDEIVAIDYIPAHWFLPTQTARWLSAPRKKKVILTIKRQNERLTQVVYLRDLI
jgi:hypothetical protein